METSINNKYIDVAAKKAMLDDVAATLKAQFVGLDYIINDVMGLVSAWYIFPGAQLRPCVINLWGLTGSGKTALVNALVELLGHKKYYAHIDMGEFESENANSLKTFLTSDVRHFHKKQTVICLDEFQFARSVDNGAEVNNDKLRVIWELVDSGKIIEHPDASTYLVNKAELALGLLRILRSQGGQIKNGEVIEGQEIFLRMFQSFTFNHSGRHVAMDASYLKSTDFITGLYHLENNDDVKTADVSKRICESDLDRLMGYMIELIDRDLTPKVFDLSHSLIFILGNLDEAYWMSSNLDPDMNADDMHEATSKITVSMIKSALRKRFRAEQIARMGNNHFLYRAFSKAQFTEIIQRELNRLAEFASKQFGWKIVFDESVVATVYSEGVVPSQGTRPVLTTINNLVQARLGKLAMNVCSSEKQIAAIHWSVEGESFRYKLLDGDNNTVAVINEVINLELLRQRTSVKPHLQAHTAVHESGHAIVAALLWRIVPSVVVSRTASPGSLGFCHVRFPEGPMTRDSMMIDTAVTLGGLAAERIVFGKEFTASGVSSDIENASSLANDAIRRYGMGNDPIRLAVMVNYSTEDYFFDTSSYEEEAVKLVRDCMTVAEGILERNKLLLLKMSEYLTTNSRMETNLIEEFVKKYSTEDWVNDSGFLKPEEYYRFDEIVKDQLKEMETPDTSAATSISAFEFDFQSQLQPSGMGLYTSAHSRVNK
ncbi:MAG TPA: hypothetical protein VF473_10000 [Cyclobacteriaceae bacterium]